MAAVARETGIKATGYRATPSSLPRLVFKHVEKKTHSPRCALAGRHSPPSVRFSPTTAPSGLAPRATRASGAIPVRVHPETVPVPTDLIAEPPEGGAGGGRIT